MKFSIKVLSVIFAFALFVSAMPVSGSAKTLEEIQAEIDANEEKLEDLANQKDQTESYINTLQEQINAYDSQIAAIEEKMAPVIERLNELNAQISEYETQIETLNTEIEKVDAQIEEQNVKIDETYEVLKQRLRAAYMAGETSELEIFLSATDFQDFLTRSELIRQVTKHDTAIVSDLREQIEDLNAMVEDLNKKRSDLNTAKAKLTEDKAEAETKKQEYESDKAKLETAQAKSEANLKKQNELIGKLDQNSALVEKLIAQAEKEKEEFSNSLDQDIANNGSSGDGSVDNGAVSHKFKVSSKGLISPLQDSTVYYSATFAQHSSRGTASVDLCAPLNRVINGKTYYTTKGAKVYAVASGTVTKSTYVAGTYGHYINIDHGNGLSSLVCHLDSRSVSVGDKVVQGQVIGTVGNTGNCWPRPTASNPVAGSHLHFEMRLNGNRVNPELYLPNPLIY